MATTLRASSTLALGTTLLLIAGTLAAPARLVAASPDFPRGYEGYHTYEEMAARVAAVGAAHPGIVQVFSIGQSHQGRELWAAKVSDNVGLDEPEPEVLYDGGHHALEHMSAEMTLRILDWLAEGYGTDPRITNVVDSREIWIVFSVNPDGAAYDISGGRFHRWRKNRQPTPGSSAVGTDLNRNYGYRWGGGGLTSPDPRSSFYRGPAAFSAPETRAMRDFLASRVIDGRQQIRTAITFHESGRLVMWPYGWTLSDVPRDMTRDDQAALSAIGRRMAATNGYRPIQASDLYVSSGSSRDYLYGTYRIFVYTFELSTGADYFDDSRIASETGRNREAVLYLAERAWCPYSVLGADVRRARCGAFDDDLEVPRGWTVNHDGLDTASGGRWQQGHAAATSSAGTKQLGTSPSGWKWFATGLGAGTSAGGNDVDGGTTSVTSRAITLPATSGQRLTFRYAFGHGPGGTADDAFRVEVVAAAGPATVFSVEGAAADSDAVWRSASVPLDTWAGQSIRLRFSATDGGPDTLVEAAFDDVRVTLP
ncbi:MAG TPA: M14 family zinc carboxypeptidase, partial [Candidatus Limnocylindrales bacterium]|nr:M14 family zinc carboxypeptidase [Candidatus Limnocylindrales bacterium]